MTQASSTTFRFAILLAGLVVPGVTAAAQEAAAETEPGPIQLVHLPSFRLAGNLTEDTASIFTEWANETVPEAIDEAPVSLVLKHTDSGTVDMATLKDLPKTSGSRTAALLAPIREQFSSEGVLLFWLEQGSRESSFQMVSLLYLPGRIQLEQFQVSANFERQSVELTEGKIQPEDFRESIRTVMLRNLRRIVAPEPAPAESANDLAPEAGGRASSRQDSQGEGSGSPTAGGGGVVHIGVLPFSLELSQRQEEARRAHGGFLSPDRLRAAAYDALRSETRSRLTRLDGSPPITHKQMVAPAIGLAGSDPRAKEKRFARQCRDYGVDALMFGHLHEEKKGSRHEMTAFLRIFDARRMKIHTASMPWPAPGRDVRLHGLVRDVAGKAGIPLLTADGDVFLFLARKGDWLSVIARKCYGDSAAFRLLGEFNRIPENKYGDVKVGQVLEIPRTLDGFRRLDPPCADRRASS